MILEAQDACNSLTFTWTTSTTRTWNIHTQQILCTDPHKPPEGCLQYFTGYNMIFYLHRVYTKEEYNKE